VFPLVLPRKLQDFLPSLLAHRAKSQLACGADAEDHDGNSSHDARQERNAYPQSSMIL
jgi:hypothetical protein